jgi:hypothetical protein
LSILPAPVEPPVQDGGPRSGQGLRIQWLVIGSIFDTQHCAADHKSPMQIFSGIHHPSNWTWCLVRWTCTVASILTRSVCNKNDDPVDGNRAPRSSTASGDRPRDDELCLCKQDQMQDHLTLCPFEWPVTCVPAGCCSRGAPLCTGFASYLPGRELLPQVSAFRLRVVARAMLFRWVFPQLPVDRYGIPHWGRYSSPSYLAKNELKTGHLLTSVLAALVPKIIKLFDRTYSME